MYGRSVHQEPVVVTMSEARTHLAEVVDRARSLHQPVFLSRRGRRVAAVIDADDLERLLDLAEDMIDIRSAAAARQEMRQTGAQPVPGNEILVAEPEPRPVGFVPGRVTAAFFEPLRDDGPSGRE